MRLLNPLLTALNAPQSLSLLAKITLALALLAIVSPVCLIAGLPAALQSATHYPTPGQPAGTPRLEFDVVSVKPADPNGRGGIVRPMPGYEGYICNNMPLSTDMTVAYGVTNRQIEGGPSWINSARWDIEAKSDQPHSVDELHLMLEHALEDRFQIKLHHETRQETVMALKVDNGGAKMTEHEPPTDTNSPPLSVSGSPDGEVVMKGTNIAMSYLAFFITRMQGTAVIDDTGLTGHYDIDVTFQSQPPPPGEPPDLSPLFEAMRSQLGLRLDKGGKGPVDYLIIDSAQKPTAN